VILNVIWSVKSFDAAAPVLQPIKTEKDQRNAKLYGPPTELFLKVVAALILIYFTSKIEHFIMRWFPVEFRLCSVIAYD